MGRKVRVQNSPVLRVAHLITDLDVGGAEHMLANLLQRSSSDLRCCVISMTEIGPMGARIEASGVPVLSLGMSRGRPSVGGFLAAARALRKFVPDVLQTWLYHADLMGLLLRPLVGRPPLVWNLRCSDMELHGYRATTRLVRGALVRLSPLADAVIANSHSARRFHEEVGYRVPRWEVISNGFDTTRFRPRAKAGAALRRELGLDDRAKLAGMVARYDSQKDHECLLRASAIVVSRRPDFYLLLVGDGLDALRADVERHGLVGRVFTMPARNDIERVYPALQVAVLSSAFGESFPNVLGEAMACGVPCVSTDVGDAREIIADTGLVVRRRDPRALAGALMEALNWSQVEHAARADAARARIERLHELSAVAGKYEALYRSLVSLGR